MNTFATKNKVQDSNTTAQPNISPFPTSDEATFVGGVVRFQTLISLPSLGQGTEDDANVAD